MDNSSPGLPERPSGLSNGPSFRRSIGSRPTSVSTPMDSGGSPHHIPIVTVIVNKDEHGYGMKVSGDNPVYVQSVKEGGAAERAGLHSGDKIIKVNGVNVTQSTHTEVVALIKSSSQVVLAVQQRPGVSPRPVSAAMTSPGLHARPLHHHHSAPARSTDRITSPLPVDHEKMRQLECQRVHTIRLMLEKEQRYVDALRSELARCNEPKLLQELAGAERRVKTLHDQLGSLTAHHADPEYSYPNSKSPSPSGTLIRQLERDLDVPPPLPSRNRPLLALHLPCVELLPPPPIPPRQFCPHLLCTEGGESHIVDNAYNLHLSPTNNYAVSPHVSPLHTHHRTKSSPDNIHNLSVAEVTKRLLASESMSDLSGSGTSPSRGKSISGSSWDVDSPRITPPGTPPPPYGGNSTNTTEELDTLHVSEGQPYEEVPPATDVPSPELPTSKSNQSTLVQQQPIISMEDDEMSDQEVSQLEDHGPFKSLNKLWEHNAHLAVFLNYVLSNSDPSSLLFYLVTDLYKEGNAKEMKKWAYEIHSSFLVPYAPLRLSNVDENIAREIDETLMHESDKEEILRKIFWKARSKAKEELNEQLADFQQKRTAGLGTIFGPPDAQLDESIHDKNKEMKIVEAILLPKLEPYMEDVERENVDPRRFTTAAALCTVIGKVFGLRGPPANALIERCPTFVSKDKSLKVKLISKTTRKVIVRGHHFVLHQYYTVTYCNHCQLIIWGIGPQGYQCTDCFLNIHRTCVKVVEENCPGPVTKKEKANDRISKLMDKIRPDWESRRKPNTLNSTHYDHRVKKQSEDESGALTDGESASGDRPVAGARTERRPDPVRESEEKPHADAAHREDDDYRSDIQHVPKKPSSTSINRSESYKERMHPKRPQRERRKHSDPNLSSKTSDVDLDPQGLSYNTNSGSSSNSSLSTRSLDSPSNSLEMVNAPRTHEAVTVTLTPNSSGQFDSDLEAEPDPPDWIPRGVDLKSLSDKEKKRQDIINELFHSERSHVRNLKVLEHVFYRPMEEQQILPADHLQLLFSNLEQMLEIHSQFNNLMKNKKKEGPIVGDIADLLLSMFDGPEGEAFQEAAARFCARQQIALELLKERRRKDAKLNNFLNEAEGNPLCRRLQLKDIIPTGMQRLTKYPLLFENLAKHTEKDKEEYVGVQRALERSKVILNNVNQAKREAEDQQRLSDIQRRLDKSGFEKVDHPMAAEFKNFDITKHRLIHEGLLSWRITNRQKCIDLHVLLLEDVILLLQKQDEKFVLKFYSTYAASGGAERSPTLSPIIKVSTVLVRPNAADKKALYLVNTSTNGAQIYDLVATSSSERKTWFRHISEAAEAYKTRDGKNRRSEPQVTAPTPDSDLSDTHVQEKSKESEEPCGDTSKESTEHLAAPGVSSSTSTTTLDAESASPGDGAPPTPADSTPQASPSSAAAAAAAAAAAVSGGGETAPRKLGEGLLSPSLHRRIEPTRIVTEESPLIEPSEVVVCERHVLTAEPVVTPIEKLRRKDEEIRLALAEKQQLVADILHVPKEEFETIADLAGEPSMDKDASELVLAAVNQANQLSALLNEVLQVTEEEAVAATSEIRTSRPSRMPSVPAHRLQDISSTLNKQLTHLLKIVKDRDDEREKLRRELQRSREHLHVMHECHRRSQLATLASPSQSRPSSYISQASSCEHPPDSEDDTGLNRFPLMSDQDDELDAQHSALDVHNEAATDVFVDALSEETEFPMEISEPEPMAERQREEC